jgi:transposase
MFVDEMGCHQAMARSHARAPKGKRVHAKKPNNRGKNQTVLGALTWEGLVALMTVIGGTTTNVFLEFVRCHLVPLLKPGMKVVMDNLKVHHADEVRRLIEATGAKIIFLPPYSPQYNPIENAWSKFKALLRKRTPRTRDDLIRDIHCTARDISTDDAEGYFHGCGYL